MFIFLTPTQQTLHTLHYIVLWRHALQMTSLRIMLTSSTFSPYGCSHSEFIHMGTVILYSSLRAPLSWICLYEGRQFESIHMGAAFVDGHRIPLAKEISVANNVPLLRKSPLLSKCCCLGNFHCWTHAIAKEMAIARDTPLLGNRE